MSMYLETEGLTFCLKHTLLYAYIYKSMCSYWNICTVLFYVLSVFKACWMLSPSLMTIENGHSSTRYRILYYFWRKRGGVVFAICCSICGALQNLQAGGTRWRATLWVLIVGGGTQLHHWTSLCWTEILSMNQRSFLFMK